VPSAVTTPSGAIRSIGSVTRSTSGRASAGYQSVENTTRLQPITESGTHLARRSGSVICASREVAVIPSPDYHISLYNPTSHPTLAPGNDMDATLMSL